MSGDFFSMIRLDASMFESWLFHYPGKSCAPDHDRGLEHRVCRWF